MFVKIISNKGKECFNGGLAEACKVMITVLCGEKMLCQQLDSFVFTITLISKKEKVFSHLQNSFEK